MKKKVYVLMISRVFPATHPRKGELTHFMSKILLNFDQVVVEYPDGSQSASRPGYSSKYAAAIVREDGLEPKITTIRENYDLWSRRAEKINRGEAVLSLRQWTASPYNYKRDGSKQVEILQLEKIQVQKVEFNSFFGLFIDDVDSDVTIDTLAKNDGLTKDDFTAWFKKIEKDVPMALINFTDFKY